MHLMGQSQENEMATLLIIAHLKLHTPANSDWFQIQWNSQIQEVISPCDPMERSKMFHHYLYIVRTRVSMPRRIIILANVYQHLVCFAYQIILFQSQFIDK